MVEKTPLYDEHVKLGGRLVDFAGWMLPVQFKGLREEHNCVRQQVGLFDVSHMGEIRLKGERALENLEWLTTNCASRLEKGQAQYTLLPNETGGIVDDLIVYCLEKGREYLLCVNAANKDKDFHWLLNNVKEGVKVIDESPFWGQIAVQGPQAMPLLEMVFGASIRAIPSFCFAELPFAGTTCIVARTGYTGEDGCEVFISSEKTKSLWQELLDKGTSLGVQACGLGARDTLRTEMKYSLYDHEIDDFTNPYAAGLGWVVKPQLKEFLGKKAILDGKEKALEEKLIGFEMVDKGIPRQGYKLVNKEGLEIGRVTSGTHSPSLDHPIGIGYVNKDFSEEGSQFYVQIRNRQSLAKVVKTPFVNPGGK